MASCPIHCLLSENKIYSNIDIINVTVLCNIEVTIHSNLVLHILHNLKPRKPSASGPQTPAFGAVEIQEYPPSSGGAFSAAAFVLQLG